MNTSTVQNGDELKPKMSQQKCERELTPCCRTPRCSAHLQRPEEKIGAGPAQGRRPPKIPVLGTLQSQKNCIVVEATQTQIQKPPDCQENQLSNTSVLYTAGKEIQMRVRTENKVVGQANDSQYQ